MNNLRDYRRALILERKILSAIAALETSENELLKHKYLSPIGIILGTIYDSKTYLEIHLAQQRKIIENKGFFNVQD